MNREDRQSAESGSAAKHVGATTNVNSLFAFVDPKDPFTPGEIAGEQLPGPILSIMSAKQFRHLFLFHTPQTREHAATEKEASSRYPECHIVVNEILVSDPKDFSSIMGRLARTVRKLMNLESSQIADCYVCVSSGTAEMRAAWFLLAALNVLPAKMLQVGSPSRPLFGEANVKEVRMDTGDWATFRDLAMPDDFFRGDSGKLASRPRAAAMPSGVRGNLSWLRRENKKPEEAVVQGKAKSGRELFEEAFAEQMRTRYGDVETERRLPSLREWIRSCFDLMLHDYRDEELSTDQFRDFGRELFGGYEHLFRRLYEGRRESYEAERMTTVTASLDLELLGAKSEPSAGGETTPRTSPPEVARELKFTHVPSTAPPEAEAPLQDGPVRKGPGETAKKVADEAQEEATSAGQEAKPFDELSRRRGQTFTESGPRSGRETFPIPGLDDALLELGIYVGSASLRHPAEQAAIAAGSHLPVLLLGETGTGKERFAHLMHRLSPRACHELVPVNCAAIPESLAESFLLGHAKGAFTGATTNGKGIFEAADRSTLFLDEIAELTLEVQAKLLRVIQDGVVQRIGSASPRKVDVRIIAASNRDLKKEVSAGRFREDLYFRLEVVQIKLPPLRDRRGEIPELALMLLRQINQRKQKPHQLTTGALKRLESQPWRGNVRDLLNVMERSVLYSRTDVIDAEDLLISCDVPESDPFAALPEPSAGFKVDEYLAHIRSQLFLRALAACKGNQTAAAELLGVSKQAVSKFFLGQSDNQS